jgi:hypothetical protein
MKWISLHIVDGAAVLVSGGPMGDGRWVKLQDFGVLRKRADRAVEMLESFAEQQRKRGR